MKAIFLWGGVGILVAAGIFGVMTFANRSAEPLGPDYSKNIPFEGATHVPEGTKVTYESNPPTSGPHWPDPLLDGIYDTEKPDEALVHSLEHGRIWVSYQPDIGEAAIQALADTVKGQSHLVMTARAANETDIALAAWTRLDAFNLSEDGTFDTQRILDFILRYRDKGPEYVPQMTGKRYE